MPDIIKEIINLNEPCKQEIINFANSFKHTADTFKCNNSIIRLNLSSHFHFTKPCRFRLPKPDSAFLIYIKNGSITLSHDKKLFSLDKNCIALVVPDSEIIYHTFPCETTGYIFILSGEQLNFYLNKLNINDIYTRKLNFTSNIGELIENIYDHDEPDNELQTIYLSNKLNDIFYELCRFEAETHVNSDISKKHIPSYITEIKELFDSKFYEEYSLDELEAMYNKNKYRITREFRAAYGLPPFQYLNKVRIQEAKKLLLNSDLNVREIGFETGIKNTNHFINLFKKETGTTPLSFRKAAPDFLKKC